MEAGRSHRGAVARVLAALLVALAVLAMHGFEAAHDLNAASPTMAAAHASVMVPGVEAVAQAPLVADVSVDPTPAAHAGGAASGHHNAHADDACLALLLTALGFAAAVSSRRRGRLAGAAGTDLPVLRAQSERIRAALWLAPSLPVLGVMRT